MRTVADCRRFPAANARRHRDRHGAAARRCVARRPLCRRVWPAAEWSDVRCRCRRRRRKLTNCATAGRWRVLGGSSAARAPSTRAACLATKLGGRISAAAIVVRHYFCHTVYQCHVIKPTRIISLKNYMRDNVCLSGPCVIDCETHETYRTQLLYAVARARNRVLMTRRDCK